MKFYKQTQANNCQITVLKTVLSHYKINHSEFEIKQQLPKHSYGNLITELGIFLQGLKIDSMLIYNNANIKPQNKNFWSSLEDYLKIGGKFIEKTISIQDLNNHLAIVNVDYFKIRSTISKRPSAHYIVYKDSWVFDGSSFNRKLKRDFNHIYNASLHINNRVENGCWLLVKDINKN
jgi:hypothetical protein